MSNELGKLVIELEADISKFRTTLGQAESLCKSSARAMETAFKSLSTAAAKVPNDVSKIGTASTKTAAAWDSCGAEAGAV